MQVEGHRGEEQSLPPATGARVSNAYATCPLQGDNPEKSGLIPHNIVKLHGFAIKGAIR